MPRGSYFLVLSVWCPKSLLYLDEDLFLKIGEIFCYYFIAFTLYSKGAFSFHLFSFSIPMIHRFGLLMMSQISYMLCFFFLNFILMF
jgi:hypothetical protein